MDGDDDDDRTVDTMTSAVAREQLDLLKQSYLRLKGWDKSASSYKSLVDALVGMYTGRPEWKDVQSFDGWSFEKERPSETLGKFVAPIKWEFAGVADLEHGVMNGGHRSPGTGVRRATINWGILPEAAYQAGRLQNGGGNGGRSKKSMKASAEPVNVNGIKHEG